MTTAVRGGVLVVYDAYPFLNVYDLRLVTRSHKIILT